MNIPSPFTENQTAYLRQCFFSWFNVAEGGKRGGKNVLQTLAYCMGLETHPSKLHLVGGYSTATARLNVLDCDGYGLLNYFEGRSRTGMYQNRDCVYLKTPKGEKIVLVSGGGKNGDEKLIKGNTYGSAYITEANECAKLFIQEVFDRTLASPDRKIYHDLNPKGEGHWYYEDILNFHEEKQTQNADYGYNYGHFTIADNLSVSDEKLKRVLGTYDLNSVWAQRDIFGRRRQAKGLIYPMFDTKKHVVPTIDRPYSEYYVSNDYGVQHPCVFLLYGLYNNVWYLVKEYYHNGEKQGQKEATEHYSDLKEFVGNLNIERVFLDNAPIASSFNVLLKRKGEFNFKTANNEVAAGLQNVATALVSGKYLINDCCKNTIREKGIYMWNTDRKDIEEPIKENDDCSDAERYFIHTKQVVRVEVKTRFD